MPPRDRPGAGFDAELFEDVLDMFFHGACAQPQDGGNLGIAFAFDDPSQDFSLTQAQPVKRGSWQGPWRGSGESGLARVLGDMGFVLATIVRRQLLRGAHPFGAFREKMAFVAWCFPCW